MEKTRLQTVAGDLLIKKLEDISEDHYAAGWMIDLSFDIWKIVLAGSGGYGMGPITVDEANELRQLAEEAGGWPVIDRQAGIHIMDMAEWERAYQAGIDRQSQGLWPLLDRSY